ncbi:MAG: hypothetical protein CGW95_12735 [Phenylobacterium zucineum]|nr:MAG: hypothetical protein CGW95_12735 [Phenylobacterium zucineum]
MANPYQRENVIFISRSTAFFYKDKPFTAKFTCHWVLQKVDAAPGFKMTIQNSAEDVVGISIGSQITIENCVVFHIKKVPFITGKSEFWVQF